MIYVVMILVADCCRKFCQSQSVLVGDTFQLDDDPAETGLTIVRLVLDERKIGSMSSLELEAHSCCPSLLKEEASADFFAEGLTVTLWQARGHHLRAVFRGVFPLVSSPGWLLVRHIESAVILSLL